MTMAKEIKLYSFEELEKDVQDKLIENELEKNDYYYSDYSWSYVNSEAIKLLGKELWVNPYKWEYDTDYHNVFIKVDYEVYIDEYLDYLVEENKIRTDDNWQEYEEKKDELWGLIDGFKGKQLKELLGCMFGDILNTNKDWNVSGYYLDNVALKVIEDTYNGENNLTLYEMLYQVFNKVLEACSEDMEEYYSFRSAMDRVKEKNRLNPYCYLEDGTYVR